MQQIITIICVKYVQKNFYIPTLIKQLFTKYQLFTKWPQISHSHAKKKVTSNGKLVDQLLIPYKSYERYVGLRNLPFHFWQL